MRSEAEMLKLIVEVAEKDDRIRAVYMNGSRTNKNVKKDIFQDYDIVYVVNATRPFIEDKAWIDVFGERLYMQYPDEIDVINDIERDFDKCYGWLIQFKDGNRLDLHVEPSGKEDIWEDKLCVVLLDKDGKYADIPEPTDEDYRIKKPSEDEFRAACNEFWWCLNNAAKGLWREEIPFMHEMFYEWIHPQLIKLLNWKIGYETNFLISTGKSSKYMSQWLPEDVWNRFLKTYINGNINDIWDSLFIMCDLFNEIANELVIYYGFCYDAEEANASYGFLKHVYRLPKDATQIYNDQNIK